MSRLVSSAFLAIVCFAGGVACSAPDGQRPTIAAKAVDRPSTTTTTTRPILANEDGCVSAEEYAALRNGMSFSNALTILGDDAEELSSSSIAGYRTVMYQ